MQKNYTKYIDFVIARYLIEKGYDNDTILNILYEGSTHIFYYN